MLWIQSVTETWDHVLQKCLVVGPNPYSDFSLDYIDWTFEINPLFFLTPFLSLLNFSFFKFTYLCIWYEVLVYCPGWPWTPGIKWSSWWSFLSNWDYRLGHHTETSLPYFNSVFQMTFFMTPLVFTHQNS
jgi:hypothetical protein